MNKAKNLLLKNFSEQYGCNPQAKACAPGRINLIGEHTDYNDGFVLPIAIEKRIYAAASVNNSETVTLCSANVRGKIAFPLSSITPAGDWGDYPKGIVAELQRKGYPMRGFDAYFLSDLPIGAGVSSSAAMEVAVCYLLQNLFEFSLSPRESAALCQQAEQAFSGTRCGIMDQFVSILGERDRALFLDCRALEYRAVPLMLDDFLLVACDSRVERGLVDSQYNRRREECNEGVAVLSGRYPHVQALRDVALPQMDAVSHLMDETIYRRCRHVVTENERVLSAVVEMERGEWKKFGDLMDQSHHSLRYDYEVSCEQLDFLVETARQIDGVVGARLTGAGFGGSTINLVHKSAVKEFQAVVLENYLRAFDIVPRIFACAACDGADRIQQKSY